MPKSISTDSVIEGKFLATLSHSKWKTTEQMVEMLDAAGFWEDEAVQASAFDQYKKTYVRRLARSVRRNGQRAFVSVKVTNAQGVTERVYKQEMLFNLNDYRQTVGYYKGQALAFIAEANRLAKNCRTRGVDKQMPLPFPSFDPDEV